MHRIRRSLTYSNVISTFCLVLLLGGGTAYAASQFGKETIGARALKKEAVTPAKLSAKAKVTLTGPAGAQGPQGVPGAAGATKIQVVVGAVGVGSFAHCPAGTVAVGGGGEAIDEEGVLFVSEPLVGTAPAANGQTPNGWFAKGVGTKPNEEEAIAYALCASP
jgi:hypothetical protein